MIGDLSDRSLVTFEVGPSGRKMKKPVTVRLPRAERPGEKAVIEYIVKSFIAKMPALIQFTFDNEGMMKLATYLLRHTTGSNATIYQYVFGIHRFCEWMGKAPDELLRMCKTYEGYIDSRKLEDLYRQLDDFLGDLQAEGLAPGTITNHIKGVKALFRASGIELVLPFKLSKKVIYRDYAPTPEQLLKISDIGTLREKTIVSILALSGIREGTLSKLKYRHVKKDIEAGITPIHIHIEADITKGKYGDYDTFLGGEAAEYLKAYIRERENGTRKMPPEKMTSESPLIRNEQSRIPKPITVPQIHKLINQLYKRAGLIEANGKPRYELRGHSIRKFFKTQMSGIGTINPDYIEYMMGHKIDTYHDVQSKGVEYLRDIYASSGLCIRPKTKLGQMDMLKAFAKSIGLNPEEILTREAMMRPHRTILTPETRHDNEIQLLSKALKTSIMDEIMSELSNNSVQEMVARERFELSSEAPEAPILDR